MTTIKIMGVVASGSDWYSDETFRRASPEFDKNGMCGVFVTDDGQNILFRSPEIGTLFVCILRLDKFAQVTDEKPAEEKPTESKQREVADGSVSQDFVLRFAAILRADNVGCNSLVNTASFMAR